MSVGLVSIGKIEKRLRLAGRQHYYTYIYIYTAQSSVFTDHHPSLLSLPSSLRSPLACPTGPSVKKIGPSVTFCTGNLCSKKAMIIMTFGRHSTNRRHREKRRDLALARGQFDRPSISSVIWGEGDTEVYAQ